MRRSTSFWLLPTMVVALLVALLVVGIGLTLRGITLQPVAQLDEPTPTTVTAFGGPDAAATPPTPTTTITVTPTMMISPTDTVRERAPRPAVVANVPNTRVSAGKFTAHSEVTLAQNPRDPRNYVGASKMFTDNENYIFRIGTYATFDGGETWIDNGQLSGLAEFTLTSDPVVAFDSQGTAYVEVLAAQRDHTVSALYIYKSTDGGRTWSEPLLVSHDARGFNDKEWLAVDTSGGPHNDSLYTAWVQITDDTYRILFARSTDQATTWSEPFTLADTEDTTRQGPVVSVDGQGNVYVLWSNITTSRFESVVSTDGGVTWSAVREGPAFQNVRPLNGNLRRSIALPAFTTDPRQTQTLYLVWDDGRRGDSDVLFAVSSDGGATWREPVVVNGQPLHDQFMPWVAVNTDGEMYIQWFDRRDDPRNLLVHTYAARSINGGETWSELRITDVASDPTVGLPRAGRAGFYGDYQALVADQTGVQLFWNETRDGQQEVYAARIPEDRWDVPYRVPDAGPPQPNAPPPQEAGD